MEYKIIAADRNKGQITVQYSNNGEIFTTVAVDVPIVDGAYITGPDLDAELTLRAPTWMIARKQAVASATNFADIEALVTP